MNSYFNLNKNYKSKNNLSFIYIIKNKFISIYNNKLLLNIINNFKITYEYNLIKKQIKYIVNRKNKLIKWKNKLYSDIIIKNNRLSLKRIYVSLPKIKHTNNNINILLFVFNKKKIYLKKILKQLYLSLYYQQKQLKLEDLIQHNNDINIKRLNYFKSLIENLKLNFNKKNFINQCIYNFTISRKIIRTNQIEDKIAFYFNVFINDEVKKRSIKLLLKRLILTNLYFNNLLFSNINLYKLKTLIYKIYKKKTSINIINTKYIYMDNNIFIDAIIRKLNDRKKRAIKVLKNSLNLIKIAQLIPNTLREKKEKLIYNNNNINYKYKNYVNTFIENKYNIIFKNIKNIHIIGISLEAKGRLTRRMTAARSVYKYSNKGSLKNIYSFFHNLPISLFRGYIKSNINKVKNSSKNKNGSFSVLSLINTY